MIHWPARGSWQVWNRWQSNGMRTLLLLFIAAATFAQEATTTDVDKLILDFDNTIRAHTQKLMAAKTDAERAALSTQFPSADSLAPTMLKILQSPPDEATAVKALSWLISRCTNLPEGQTAMQLLKDKYAGSAGLLELLDFLAHSQPAVSEPLLRAIREKNPNTDAKAAATFGLGMILFAVSDGNPQAAGKMAEATQYFQEMLTTYKDVVARGFKLSDQAAAMLFELENLQTGKPAPEIEGKDSTGTAFKLSDYRGKVAVVIFWGSWCHACHGTMDGVRAAVEKQGDKAVLLGVNTDPLETFKTLPGITWRNWCDEFNRGPISAMWNIRHWPTIYVIDAKGVIRGKDVPAPGLEAAINAALAG